VICGAAGAPELAVTTANGMTRIAAERANLGARFISASWPEQLVSVPCIDLARDVQQRRLLSESFYY
jgi:hypothetical protein